MSDALIAPQGLIRGTVTSGNMGELGPLRYEALIWLDGWLNHYSRDNSDPAKPWYRMHDPDDKGMTEADFPAPLVVGDKLGKYQVAGYEALIVRNGQLFRYQHDNVQWTQWGSGPIGFDVIGAPTMFRAHDDVFTALHSTIQALVPTRKGLLHYSYLPDWDLWTPRGIITRDETGWPTGFSSWNGNYAMFFESGGKLHTYGFGTEPLFYGAYEYDNNIPRPAGPPSAIQGWPSIDFDVPLPFLTYDDYQMLVPMEGKHEKGRFNLVHYWRSAQFTPNWSSAQLPGAYTGGAALMTTGPRTMLRNDDAKHKESDDSMLALAPVGRDIFSISRDGESGTWSQPVFAI